MSPSRTRISPIRSELAAGTVKCATPPGEIFVCSWVGRTSRRCLYGDDAEGGKRLPDRRFFLPAACRYPEHAGAHPCCRKGRASRGRPRCVLPVPGRYHGESRFRLPTQCRCRLPPVSTAHLLLVQQYGRHRVSYGSALLFWCWLDDGLNPQPRSERRVLALPLHLPATDYGGSLRRERLRPGGLRRLGRGEPVVRRELAFRNVTNAAVHSRHQIAIHVI